MQTSSLEEWLPPTDDMYHLSIVNIKVWAEVVTLDELLAN